VFKAKVAVSFKTGVLDPEAQAIERSLAGLGFAEVRGVRRTKLIELEIGARDHTEAERQVRAMCEKLLANPVIETFHIEIEN
jgi:phosphoribosylformylglycinamidine synthase subunit PurS